MSFFQKRPALILIGFIAGVFLARYSLFISIPLIALSLISLIFLRKKAIPLILCAVLFLSGSTYTNFINFKNLKYASALLGNDKTVTATIVSIPESENYGQSAIAETNGVRFYLMSSDTSLEYMDKISVKGNFNLPDSKSRDFDFDYPVYLKTKGVYLTCYGSEITHLGSELNLKNPYHATQSFKVKLIKKANTLWDGEVLMFARAILLGDSSLESPEFKDKMSKGSISHVISVSGTHVSLVAFAVLFFLKRLSVRRRWINLLSVPFVCFFVMLITPAPSSVRALIMFLCFTISYAFLLHHDGITNLLVAATLILIVNPFSAFSFNFLLSFGAVLGIILFSKHFVSLLSFLKIPYIIDCLSLTISAQIFILPILILYFYKIPLFSLLANLIVVPLIPFIMAFGYLSLLLPWPDLFAEISRLLMLSSLKIAEFFGSFPFSNISFVPASKVMLILCFISFIAFLTFIFIRKSKRLSFISLNVFLAFLLMLIAFPKFFPKKATYILDVAQDNSVISLNKSSSVLVDVPEDCEIVHTYLLKNGHFSLDVLVLTEYNEGDDSVVDFLDTFSVENIILPYGTKNDMLLDLAEKRDIRVIYVSAGDEFKLPGISLSVPYEAMGTATYILKNGDDSILITGEIEKRMEEVLSDAVSSHIDYVICPRHGNKDSLSSSLLDKTKPKAVIISTDRRISDSLDKRLSGCKVFSTKTDGDITIKKGEINSYKRGD